MPIQSTLCAIALAPQAIAPIAEVPFRAAEDAIIVDAVVNGANVSLMFDTGFSGAVAISAAIDIGKPTGKMTLRDFVGTMEVPTTKIKTLKFGNSPVNPSGMVAVSLNMGDMSFGYNTHTDGIMGFEVIQNFVTEINFEKKKFILYPKAYDITNRKPDNKRTFLAKLLPMGHQSLEMEVVASTGKKLVLALDTGNAFYATTHRDVLERVGLWPENRKPKFTKLSGVASGTVESWDVRMKDVTIYGVPVKESIWNIIDAPSSSAEGDGTIGHGFLSNFNIVIDYDRRRVWLENFTGKVANEPIGELGLSAGYSPRDKNVLIYRVAPDSPAAKAGIKEGDYLLSVDGEEMLDGGYRRLEKLLKGPKGTKVKLVTSRDGSLKRYELERDYLINEF